MDNEVYQVEMKPGFNPYRRGVRFYKVQEASIRPILDRLHFVDSTRNWGHKFMRGFLEIDQHDFELIFDRMIK